MMRQRNGFVRKMLAGFLIGIGCILPGVSGGVMAVSFGLYRPMLDAVMQLWRTPVRSLCFLAPLAIGGAAGMALGAAALSTVMARYETLMLFLFTGFILGGVPDLLHEAEQNSRFRPRWLLSLLLGVLLALPLGLVGDQSDQLTALTTTQAFLTGLLEGVGTVVPGISTSFVLLRLGWYQAYLTAVRTLDVVQLLPLGAGFALSAAACMRGVKWLFDRHTGHACYAVLGFLLVSVALVFPGFSPGRLLWAEVGVLVIGTTVARIMGQK